MKSIHGIRGENGKMYEYNVEHRCNAMKPNQDAETMFCLSRKEGVLAGNSRHLTEEVCIYPRKANAK